MESTPEVAHFGTAVGVFQGAVGGAVGYNAPNHLLTEN
jgi:hypothetical protein